MNIRIICLIFALTSSGMLQIIWAQSTYDLQFANESVNCTENQFCTILQIKSSDSDSMAFGSHTVFFEYNTNSINHPVYTALHYSNNETCTPFGTSPYTAAAFGSDTLSGEANVTTLMTFPNMGCPVITSSEWTTMGTLCFDIINPFQSSNLVFNQSLTIFNLNDNFPEHIQGNFQNLNVFPICATSDTDNDGLTDLVELNIGTSPTNTDTDGDLLTDNVEVNILLTNPLLIDTDNDGIFDVNEDPDLDNLNNGTELSIGTNPLNPDTDSDQLNDDIEISIASNPLDPDTDQDHVSDSIEAPNGNPINTDNDNLPNIIDDDDDNDGILTVNEDANQNNNPSDDDSDNDNLPDYLDPDLVAIHSPNKEHFNITIQAGQLITITQNNLAAKQVAVLKINSINGNTAHTYDIPPSQSSQATIQIPLPTFPTGVYIIGVYDKFGALIASQKNIL